MLFVTTAPAPASETRPMDPPVSSRNPEASIVGFRSLTPATSVRRSTIRRTEMTDVLKSLGGRDARPHEPEPFASLRRPLLLAGRLFRSPFASQRCSLRKGLQS